MIDYQEDALTLADTKAIAGHALLEFGAPWCGHCKAAQPAIQEVLSECTRINHIKIYDGKGKPLGRAFGVKLWPTLVLLNDGEEVARLVRPLSSSEVRELVEIGISNL